MKRPAFAVSLILLATAALLYKCGTVAGIAAALVLLLFSAVCSVFKRNIQGGRFAAYVLLLSSLLCLIMTAGSYARILRSEALAGSRMPVTARVTEEPHGHGAYTRLEVKTVDGGEGSAPSGIKLTVSVNGDDDAAFSKVGDIISFDGQFSLPDERYRSSGYAEGVFVSCFADNIKQVGHRYTPYETCVALRSAIRSTIRERLSGDDAALACGVLLGDISGISDRLYSDLKVCGVSHIVAVSGLHISIMCSAVMGLFCLIFKRRTARLCSLGVVLLGVAVTGFTPSAIRAGIMCAAAFGAGAAIRCKDSLNSLGIAVILMLLYEPFYVLHIGFLLSCSATAGVIVAGSATGKLIDDKVNIRNFVLCDIVKNTLSVAAQSVGAAIFTLPITMIVFGYVSTVSPVANIAISFAVGYLLLSLLAAVILSALPFVGFFSVPFFSFATLVSRYISAAVGLIAKIPFSYIPLGSCLALLITALCLGLAGVWLLCSRPGGIKLLSLMLALLTVTGMWAGRLAFADSLQITAVNAGSGFCAVIKYNRSVTVIGCGDDKKDVYAVSAILKEWSAGKIDTLIMPEGNAYWGGFDALASKVGIGKIAVTDKSLLSGHKVYEKTAVSVVGEGEMFSSGNVLTFCFEKGGDSVLMLSKTQKFIFGINGRDLPHDAHYIIALLPPDGKFRGIYMSPVFYPQSISDSYTVVAEGTDISVTIKEGKEPVFYAVK